MRLPGPAFGSLEELNGKLARWRQEIYHPRDHDGSGESPQERFARSLPLLRPLDRPPAFSQKTEPLVVFNQTLNPCRPDWVSFANGLPLVVIGLKKPGVPARAAFDENLTPFMVSFGTSPELSPHSPADTSSGFATFSPSDAEKGIEAEREALFWFNALLIASMLAARKLGHGRGGVFWQTQGSRKSFRRCSSRRVLRKEASPAWVEKQGFDGRPASLSLARARIASSGSDGHSLSPALQRSRGCRRGDLRRASAEGTALV